jgi:hypothetical protein
METLENKLKLLHDLCLEKYTIRKDMHPDVAANYAVKSILNMYKTLDEKSLIYVIGLEIEDVTTVINTLK